MRLVLVLMTALPLALVAALMAVRAARGYQRAGAARAWPTAGGRVVRAGVRETLVRQRVRTGTSRYRMATRYAPDLLYEYEVGGRRYQGQRLYLGDAIVSSDTHAAERAAARYPLGSQVLVYYNPADPADATLEPRAGAGTAVLWLVALALLGMSALLVVLIMS